MPEGDTIHNVARRLSADLDGATLSHLSVARHGTVGRARGARVERVHAIGKHLIVSLDVGLALRVHLGMHGRWRRTLARASYQGTRRLESVVLATQAVEWVCRRAMQTEVFDAADLERNPALSRLGPDVVTEDFSVEAALARAQAPHRRSLAVADLLLDQSVACGIGNVYKSEVLFLCRVNPWLPVHEVPRPTQARLYETAHQLMRENLRDGPRVTFHEGRRRLADPNRGPRTWVYGRVHKPCLECGTPVRVRRQGDNARTTFFCPTCQNV